MAIKKAKAQATQQFSINKDELCCQVLALVEETQQQVIKLAQALLEALGSLTLLYFFIFTFTENVVIFALFSFFFVLQPQNK